MGSPLAPILANLFLGFHEETWLNNFDKADILLYRRYVDDTFCVFKNEQDAMSFFDFITVRRVVCAKNTRKSSAEAKKEIAKGEFLCLARNSKRLFVSKAINLDRICLVEN